MEAVASDAGGSRLGPAFDRGLQSSLLSLLGLAWRCTRVATLVMILRSWPGWALSVPLMKGVLHSEQKAHNGPIRRRTHCGPDGSPDRAWRDASCHRYHLADAVMGQPRRRGTAGDFCCLHITSAGVRPFHALRTSGRCMRLGRSFPPSLIARMHS